MLISIIIPTRNRPEYIKLMIQDILKQDVSNYEIIVVDQSEMPEKLVHCNHIITNTLGPCISRNIGVKESKGEVLVFLDDDARIGKDFIREITRPIIEDRFDVVAGAVCNPKGEYLRKKDSFLKNKNKNFIKVITANPDFDESRITLAFPGCCSAISKSVIEATGGFDESFDPTGAGEDRDMALNLYTLGYSIWYNAKAKLLHEVAPIGGTRDVGSRSMMLDIHTYKMCKKYFSQELSIGLKSIILERYRSNLTRAFFEFSKIRTKYRALQKVKKLLKE